MESVAFRDLYIDIGVSGSEEAKELAFEMGHHGNFSEDPVDSLAAKLILESWWRFKGPENL